MKKQVNNIGGSTLEAISTGLFIASAVVDHVNAKTFRKDCGLTQDQYMTARLKHKAHSYENLCAKADAIKARYMKPIKTQKA